MIRRSIPRAVAWACLLAAAGTAAHPGETPRSRTGTSSAPSASPTLVLEPAMLSALKARSIGPAVMGGRVSDIALDPQDPFTFYVALGTGGLMKTSDDGATWSGVFEKEAVAAVGAVAVAPSDPKVVWVGTGEGNDRNSTAWGNGVYRSTDAGATWTHVGLEDSKAISRIVVHPTDPATAWVAVLGDLWQPSPERGLYKTADGGKTWKAVLTGSVPYGNRIGCRDVALDPKDPNVLYAALYARRRTPWSFAYGPAATDGKDLGGLFKSTDGGATWKKLENGLPRLIGNVGLDVHRKDPRVVYAIVQSDEGGQSSIDDVKSKAGGVFRSEDAGLTWTRMSGLNPRPFYFSQVRVDPENDKRVYVLGFAVHVSEDGGATWREDHFQKVHPDCHAMAIDPRNPKRVLLGTDGGVYRSVSGGEKGWEHLNRIAAGEFYRISADESTPYRICGGLQDNLNWVGPSATRSKEGILNSDWTNIGGGDGFYCVFDPEDRDVIFAESQEGTLHRMNLRTGEVKNLRPEPAEGQPRFRFHWNSPLIGSRHSKGAKYLAGNRVFKLEASGERWKAISPDLSGADPHKISAVGSGAENYAVVYTLAESPLRPGLLWAGTDDGKVWLTENDGESWTDLTANLPPAAKGQWMSRIEASAHDPKVAYLAVSAFRSGDYAPLVYRTGDGGKSWQGLASNLPEAGPAKVVREDPTNPSLLFAGTEFGLFVSLDRGGRWTKLGGLPMVAVDDILVHPRDRDLVIATHGRSLYVIDDIRALEGMSAEIKAKAAHLFPPRPALGFVPLPGFADWNGNAVFRGANPPPGAILDVYVQAFTGDPLKIAIASAAGRPVASLTAPGTPGLNRVVWDLKPTKDFAVEYGSQGVKLVPPGEYKLTLTYGALKQEQMLTVDVVPGMETW
jgi:photosystem II stability/assembly factor-like uncharacterized protein